MLPKSFVQLFGEHFTVRVNEAWFSSEDKTSDDRTGYCHKYHSKMFDFAII